MKKVAVLGAGSWGTALSMVLADNGHDVRLWTHRKEQADEINEKNKNSRYLENPLPKSIKAFYDIERAIEDVEAVVLVVPTKAIREVCQKIKDILPKKATIIHASKGIEPETLKRISEMIHEEIPSYQL